MGRGKRLLIAGGLLAVSLAAPKGKVAAVPAGAAGAGPGELPPVLPVAEGVKDPGFALVLGIMDHDLVGFVSEKRLEAEIRRLGRRTRLPIRYFRGLRRQRLPRPGGALVSLSAWGPVNVPAPYDILGYHPGKFRLSPRVVLEEWKLGSVVLQLGKGKPGGKRRLVRFDDVRVWGIREGYVEMDVDGWLDALLGSRLDDTQMLGFAVLRYRGERIGLVTGYDKKGRGRSGAFRFSRDETVFPNRDEFKAAGAYLRGWLERKIDRGPAWVKTH